MSDVFTKEKRSSIMSKIKSKNTRLEIYFCKLISKEVYPYHFRYRRNYKKLTGCPDIVFVKNKIAIFIDGDFWHGYKFEKRKSKLPKIYWKDKILNNMKRDKKTSGKLRRIGWEVIRIWEHNIKKNPLKEVDKVKRALGLN